MTFSVTPAAARRIEEILADDGRADASFRVMVDGGGCMGFQYRMDVDALPMDGDVEIRSGAARIVVDGVSGPLLAGAELDWVSDIVGERFEVRNPNAASSCGCGTSFSV